jgi:hypothetical protein
VRFVRHGLPLIIVVAGVVAAIADPDRLEAAILICSAGLSVWMLNWLWRVGVAGDREREDEDRAREYFDRHGRWPDEPPPDANAR